MCCCSAVCNKTRECAYDLTKSNVRGAHVLCRVRELAWKALCTGCVAELLGKPKRKIESCRWPQASRYCTLSVRRLSSSLALWISTQLTTRLSGSGFKGPKKSWAERSFQSEFSPQMPYLLMSIRLSLCNHPFLL